MENGKTYFEDRGAYVLLTIQSRWLNIRLQYNYSNEDYKACIYSALTCAGREGKQPVYTSLLDMEYMGQVLTGIVLWSMVLMLLLGSVYIYIYIYTDFCWEDPHCHSVLLMHRETGESEQCQNDYRSVPTKPTAKT